MHGKTPLKLSQLLRGRQRSIQRAGLANSAYAYVLLNELAGRIARANLHGRVVLKSADPENERFCATLTALRGNQSLIEEHFTDEDILDLADAVGYITGESRVELEFEIEDFAEAFLSPLRAALEHAGVVIDRECGPSPQHSSSDSASAE